MAQYNGSRVLFGYCSGHGTLIERMLHVPAPAQVYGWVLPQEGYDQIEPGADKYYAIFPTADGGQITALVHCTQAEYDAATRDTTTLYFIEDSGEIKDTRYGNTRVDKIYLNSEVYWHRINLVAPMDNTSFWTEGLYDKTNTLTANSNYVYSPLIKVDPSVRYVWRWDNPQLDPTSGTRIFLAYDSNKQFLAGAQASSTPSFGAIRDGNGYNTQPWNFPSETKYIRICTRKCDYFLFAAIDDVNIFLPFTDASWEQNKYLTSSGSLSSQTGYATSDYIPIPDGVSDIKWAYYDPNPTGEHWSCFILYDANKNKSTIDNRRPATSSSNWFAVTTPIPGFSPGYNTLPSNAKYIRISIAKCDYTCCLTDKRY